MVYIKYPLESLETHKDLVAWNANTTKAEGDWKMLRGYLCAHLVHTMDSNGTEKCWYSECYQLDKFAKDVEHFRPKKRATPINGNHKIRIEKFLGAAIPQENDTYAYPWLEFNHINYRFVTASVNRAGAKGTCFPIMAGTTRLPKNTLPNDGLEYHLLLDPCNRHDANLLYVDPTGQIHPKANLSLLNNQQIQNPDLHWHEEAINYIRALSTIIVYGLDDSSFVIGRQRKYEGFTELVNRLKDAIEFKEKLNSSSKCN